MRRALRLFGLALGGLLLLVIAYLTLLFFPGVLFAKQLQHGNFTVHSQSGLHDRCLTAPVGPVGRSGPAPGHDPEPIRARRREHAVIDDPDQALDVLRRLAADADADADQGAPVARARQAIWAAFHGDAYLALQLLEEATSAFPYLIYLAWLPVFEPVRQLPEFKDLLIDIGLVDYWRAAGWPEICRPVGADDFVCV